jgi:hypothetical protein
MPSYYRLKIDCSPSKKKQLDSILGPSNDEFSGGWAWILDEKSPHFPGALIYFADFITANLHTLKNAEISMDDITLWYLYEYVGQCNMEFGPDITKKIGELGVVFCISCWEK